MKINFSAKVIEMTAKFAKAAAKFGSDEYRQLQEALSVIREKLEPK